MIAETNHMHKISRFNDFLPFRATNETVIFIDSVRDPIDRKFSAYFANIEHLLGMDRKVIEKRYKEEGTRFIQKDFREIYVKWMNEWSFLDWKNWLGFDVFDGVFDTENKIQICKRDYFYFVNLRLNDAKDWDQIIRNSGLPLERLSEFRLLSRNRSDGRWYSQMYEEFKRDFIVLEEEYEEIYNRHKDVLTHFHMDKAFEEKWGGGATTSRP